jgi:hypothetical protein
VTVAVSQAFPRVSGAVAALVLSTALFQAAPARANIVFDFSGVCSLLCSGTVTGVLTLADSYTFGADITDADFISFDFSSPYEFFDITSANIPLLTGGLNADGSFNSAGQLYIQSSTDGPLPLYGRRFGASAEGFVLARDWLAEHNEGGFAPPTFTLVGRAVPEPSTWAMMLLGFAGLGLAGYRKVKQAAIAGA